MPWATPDEGWNRWIPRSPLRNHHNQFSKHAAFHQTVWRPDDSALFFLEADRSLASTRSRLVLRSRYSLATAGMHILLARIIYLALITGGLLELEGVIQPSSAPGLLERSIFVSVHEISPGRSYSMCKEFASSPIGHFNDKIRSNIRRDVASRDTVTIPPSPFPQNCCLLQH